MGVTFGECAILNDGRLVIAPWDATGLWVGATFVPGPHLRLPDACLTAGGRVWAVGAIQTGGVQVWSQSTGWLALPFPGPFGTRTIIRADGEGCRVAVATSATTWTCVGVSQSGAVAQISTGPVPNGGGGAGMRNWDSAGNPRSCAPIDSTVSGHPVRLAITEGPVTIACGLGDLPDQLVLSKMGPLGTLQLCAPEWATLRLSSNGQWWVVTQFGTSPKVFSGAIPATVPPLITNTEPPVVEPPIPPNPKPPTMTPQPGQQTIVTPFSYAQFVNVEARQVWDAYLASHGVTPAITDMYHFAYRRLFEGWSQERILADIRATGTIHPPTTPIEPGPPLPVPDIHAAGKIFKDAANTPWRYKGVSGFKLGNIFETGGDIRPFLDAYRGFNVIRVWAYTDWAGTGWARPSSVNAVRDFLAFVANHSGHLIEYTYITNDSAEAHDWASGFVQQLYSGPRPRLFNEIRNEPQTHSQTISTKRCKPAFDASGAVYASGNYEHSENAFGPYLVAHTQRDSEWPRRCHDLMEYFNGKGPHNVNDPAHKVPCVADEPAKTQDVAPPKAPLTKADDWRAYFGGCALLGAGATFHSETGKWGQPPTAEEATLAAAALEGLNAFPADAPLGNYSRPSDSSLRTYVVGNYSVRIRPTTDKHPVSGFTRIGSSNILWKR